MIKVSLLLLSLLFYVPSQAQDCSTIIRTADGPNTSFSSPANHPIVLSKVLAGDQTTYFLSVIVQSSVATAEAAGLVLFFDTIDPIKFPEAKVTYRNYNGRHTYLATVELNPSQMDSLT